MTLVPINCFPRNWSQWSEVKFYLDAHMLFFSTVLNFLGSHHQKQICSRKHIHFPKMTQHKILLPYTLVHFSQSISLPTAPNSSPRTSTTITMDQNTVEWPDSGWTQEWHAWVQLWIVTVKAIQQNCYVCLPNWNFILTLWRQSNSWSSKGQTHHQENSEACKQPGR